MLIFQYLKYTALRSEATELALELCRVWNTATDFICVDRLEF